MLRVPDFNAQAWALLSSYMENLQLRKDHEWYAELRRQAEEARATPLTPAMQALANSVVEFETLIGYLLGGSARLARVMLPQAQANNPEANAGDALEPTTQEILVAGMLAAQAARQLPESPDRWAIPATAPATQRAPPGSGSGFMGSNLSVPSGHGVGGPGEPQ